MPDPAKAGGDAIARSSIIVEAILRATGRGEQRLP
jgi:hypothetical protein